MRSLIILFFVSLNIKTAFSQYPNTRLGDSALFSILAGEANVALGAYALDGATQIFNSTAVGAGAMGTLVSGDMNTAIGFGAMVGNPSAFTFNNTAVGGLSMYVPLGNNNVAVGTGSMGDARNVYNSVAVGAWSLFNARTPFNVAVGSHALHGIEFGTDNVGVGVRALPSNSQGSHNTAMGDSAGLGHDGEHGTYIGYRTFASQYGFNNSTAIGSQATITAPNQVRLGNAGVRWIGGAASWTTLSDGRFKEDVKSDVPGLEFISKLKPVTYVLNRPKLSHALGELYAAEPSQERHSGFIAQEVQATAKELNYEFSGVDEPKNSKDFYGLRYAEFVVPLVKSVQELSAASDAQDKLIAEQLALIEELTTAINIKENKGWISQNSPNPSGSSTNVEYYVPSDIKLARLIVIDIHGNPVANFNVSGRGKVTISTSNLAPGTYSYRLIANGKTIQTRKLTVINK